jgi:hypothetical protein
MGAKEEARRCQKCGNQWWAVRVAKQPTPRWFDDGASFTGNSAARNVRLAHRKSEQIRESERYGLCTRCGSQDIKTVRDRGFIPTGLAESAPQVQGAPPVPPAATTPLAFQPGEKVTLHVLGFRGLTGVVEGLGLTGYKVRLDRDNQLVRSVPPHKMARL